MIGRPLTGGPQDQQDGISEAFIPEYKPEEILKIAQKFYAKAR